jgi:hypothetical protein
MLPNPSKLTPGQSLYGWRIVEIDPTGKRVAAQCRCGQIRIIAAEDLLSGARRSCGCRPAPAGHDIARMRAREQHQRSREHFDWRPERGR